jgi:hypothetical protein
VWRPLNPERDRQYRNEDAVTRVASCGCTQWTGGPSRELRHVANAGRVAATSGPHFRGRVTRDAFKRAPGRTAEKGRVAVCRS